MSECKIAYWIGNRIDRTQKIVHFLRRFLIQIAFAVTSSIFFNDTICFLVLCGVSGKLVYGGRLLCVIRLLISECVVDRMCKQRLYAATIHLYYTPFIVYSIRHLILLLQLFDRNRVVGEPFTLCVYHKCILRVFLLPIATNALDACSTKTIKKASTDWTFQLIHLVQTHKGFMSGHNESAYCSTSNYKCIQMQKKQEKTHCNWLNRISW